MDVLCDACATLKWSTPSKIQKEAIPLALQGKDIIGLAETGSGKTGAFALPILQALLQNPQRFFALILTPTRELAFQISEQFEALGKETTFRYLKHRYFEIFLLIFFVLLILLSAYFVFLVNFVDLSYFIYL